MVTMIRLQRESLLCELPSEELGNDPYVHAWSIYQDDIILYVGRLLV